jgi:signal transduction histidine kinase
MRSPFHHIEKSITNKLVITISALVLCCGFLFWYLSIRNATRISVNDALAYTTSLSELAKNSLRHDMLTAQRDDIQRIVQNISRSGAVDDLQIVNMEGTIAYSNRPQKIGQPINDELIKKELAKDTVRVNDYLGKKLWFIRQEDEEHYRELTYIEPIINEADCSSAACHIHRKDQDILGFLKTDFPLQLIDARLQKQKMQTSLYLIVFVAAMALFLSYILWHFVIKPLSALDAGMKSVSTGDLSPKIYPRSEDEIGRLAMTFNKMTTELNTARQKLELWNQSLEMEVKRQTIEIRQTQDKLIQAEKLAALGRLSADIAHEIRNPLTALGGFGRRLLKSATTEKQIEYAQIVVSEVDRLEKILRDILAFSRESKKNFSKMPLVGVVEESLHFFEDMCNEHNITVVFKNDSSLPVLIDKAHARQAVNNLIINAIAAMSDGGTLTVTIKEEQENEITYVTLHLDDTGPGIPADQLAMIFEPFFTGKPTGTGLGLPISQKIIEEHGGMIKVANRQEGGCRVSLYFPYQSDEETAKTQCWEFMQCGREKNCEAKCPANPNFGRICWAVAGTLCAGKVQGTFAQKITSCRNCDFYRHVKEGSV